MPMPSWWGRVNKRVFNPRALNSGKWAVITHVGRSTGRIYRTPLEAIEVGETVIIVLVYGSRSDWVQNVLASGSATVEAAGQVLELTSPRLIDREAARPLLDGRVKPPPGFLRIDEYLQMDVVTRLPAERPQES
jgi:deazaflavin-dependent oxidoreductase (nitroreductase family)